MQGRFVDSFTTRARFTKGGIGADGGEGWKRIRSFADSKNRGRAENVPFLMSFE